MQPARKSPFRCYTDTNKTNELEAEGGVYSWNKGQIVSGLSFCSRGRGSVLNTFLSYIKGRHYVE